MNKILLIAIALIAMIGTASAGYGIGHDVTGPITLDTEESQTFMVTVTDASSPSTFSVDGASMFTVTIDGGAGPVAWNGTDKTFEVVVTNDMGASNGAYVINFKNVDSSGTAGLATTVEVLITTIPEFPTIALPIAAILGLAFIFQRRKEEE